MMALDGLGKHAATLYGASKWANRVGTLASVIGGMADTAEVWSDPTCEHKIRGTIAVTGKIALQEGGAAFVAFVGTTTLGPLDGPVPVGETLGIIGGQAIGDTAGGWVGQHFLVNPACGKPLF